MWDPTCLASSKVPLIKSLLRGFSKSFFLFKQRDSSSSSNFVVQFISLEANLRFVLFMNKIDLTWLNWASAINCVCGSTIRIWFTAPWPIYCWLQYFINVSAYFQRCLLTCWLEEKQSLICLVSFNQPSTWTLAICIKNDFSVCVEIETWGFWTYTNYFLKQSIILTNKLMYQVFQFYFITPLGT